MFDSTYATRVKTQNAVGNAETPRRDETPEEAHARQVREWTEKLSNAPGKRGRLLRRALASGWC